MISWAVDAFWRALTPGLAKETLPTRTLWTTVLERDDEGRERRRRERGMTLTAVGMSRGMKSERKSTDDAAKNIAFVWILVSHAEIGKDGSLVLVDGVTGRG